MKILSVAGISAACMISAFSSTPAISQSEAPEFLTCRAALEGTPFQEILQAEAPPCCYVTEEIVWYSENDVLVGRFYQKVDELTYYTTDACVPVAGGSLNSASSPATGTDLTTTGSVPTTTTTDPDGTTTDPDGTTTDPDGNTTDPDGTTTDPDGTTTDPDGTTTDPDGTTTDPDGTTTDPDGTTTDPDGTTTDPDDTDDGVGNPGNQSPVGGAGEDPNSSDGFGPNPDGDKGASDNEG